MMYVYAKVLQDMVEREKKGTDFFCSETDRIILSAMCEEINAAMGSNWHYLAEFVCCDICGSGEIISKYIEKFETEGIKAMLFPQMVSDRVKNCDQLAVKMYAHFRNSPEYISKPGMPSPAHITVRYDNAIHKLKPKRFAEELLAFAYYPRDVYYLPFTMRMLASWKKPELESLFLGYLDGANVTYERTGITEGEPFFPSLKTIQRDILFTSLACLKYYPSAEVIERVKSYENDLDPDIKVAAEKTIKAFQKKGFIH